MRMRSLIWSMRDQRLELLGHATGHKPVGIVPRGLGADAHRALNSLQPLFQTHGLPAALAEKELPDMVRPSLLQGAERWIFEQEIRRQSGRGIFLQHLKGKRVIDLVHAV